MPDIDVRTYFALGAPQIPGVTVRAANALLRGGIDTMDELAGKSDYELGRVRNMGAKTRELAIAMRDKYVSENNINLEEKT